MSLTPKEALLVLVVACGAPLPALAQAQTCPCYGSFTCNGNCAGSVCCNFGCTDYATDPYNCGGCGKSCGAKSTCAGGVCQCVTGDVRACYTGPFGTSGQGACTPGTQTCAANVWSVCQGEVTPAPEQCNGVDDDCDGKVDNAPLSSGPLSQACYTGPPGTEGTGTCKGGKQLCQTPDGGMPGFGACLGEVTPATGGTCGPDGGAPPPADAGTCGELCYDGPAGTAGVGACRAGVLTCLPDGGVECNGQILPQRNRCGGQDYDCDGTPDTACSASLVCSNGLCVPYCGGEVGQPCPTGYACTGAYCTAVPCVDGGVCPMGEVCVLDACRPPCDGKCLATETCYQDLCVPDDCTSFGCAPGQACVQGQCVVDSCLGDAGCAPDQQCRRGACAPSCAAVSCPAGQRCEAAACVPDPCAGVSCGAGMVCSEGACVMDPCTQVACPPARRCQGGACVEDPCVDLHCPAGAYCSSGECLSFSPPGPAADGGAAADGGSGSGGDGGEDAPQTTNPGCGCGAGADPAALALALSALGWWAGTKRRTRGANR